MTMQPQQDRGETVLQAAHRYTRAGLSVIPIRGDGSKAPALPSWRPYQERVATDDELQDWFGRDGDRGLAILGRNGVEILDFDRPGLFDQFHEVVEERQPGLVDRLPRVATPSGGVHLFTRSELREGNQKLARDTNGKTLIETRGEGGYVVAPPSPPCCHPARRPYVHVAGTGLHEIPHLRLEERSVLHEVARSFNQKPDRDVDEPRRGTAVGGRPGDIYNEAVSWREVLEPAGWTVARANGEVLYWRKPRADGPGHHATTGHCGDRFHCFSTSSPPFEPDTTYTKFTAYALLYHDGDFGDAARDLAARGYGPAPAPEAASSQPALVVPSDRPHEAPDDPHRLARLLVERRCRHADGLTLRYWRGEWHRWDGAAYHLLPESEVRAEVCEAAKAEFDRVNLLELKDYDHRRRSSRLKRGEEPPTVRKVTQGLVGNIIQALGGLTVLPARTGQPAWVEGDGPCRAEEVLAAVNGLVHLPSLDQGGLDLVPPTPRFFSPTVLDYAFDAAAPEPAEWLSFLHDMWPDDPESIQTLQEWFGYCLLPDTRLQKMLLIIGPKRSGKGTLARVLSGVVGPDNLAGPTLSGLASPFGLAPLLGKTVAIVSDARLSGRVDAAIITERLLSISGEDTLTVDRKHLPAVSVKLASRFVILTNELPRLNDTSGALAGRMLLLRLTRSWFGREDPRLTERLLSERPGILLWAIAGWRRLRERGRFLQPDAGQELLGQLEDLTSPIGEFLREYCEIGPDRQVVKAELYERWKWWCEGAGRQHPGDLATFGRNLMAAVPTARQSQPRDGAKRVPTYRGIGLRAA
jgi:putative DNA primase/helicase